MNSTSSKLSSTKLTNCARSFIVRAFILCSLFSSSLASADFSSSDSANIEAILKQLNGTTTGNNLYLSVEDIKQTAGSIDSRLATLVTYMYDVRSDVGTLRSNSSTMKTRVTSIDNQLGYLGEDLSGLYAVVQSLWNTYSNAVNSSSSPVFTNLVNVALTNLLNVAVTNSFTFSPTNVITFTPTITNAFTFTPTITNSFTFTPTITNAFTFTPTITNSFTFMPTNSITVFVTNQTPSVDVDQLDGNPWWYTNSQFTASKIRYSAAFPRDPGNQEMFYSFPEFMSMIAAKLEYPETRINLSNLQTPSNRGFWWQQWGMPSYDRWGTMGANNGWLGGYTWFDWVSDAMRSNIVANASHVERIIDAMPTNRPSDVFLNVEQFAALTNLIFLASTGDVSFTNQVSVFVSNYVQQTSQALAENPWWWTNSGFAITWSDWQTSSPYPNGRDGLYDFPWAYSVDLNTRIVNTERLYGSEAHQRDVLFNWWGYDGVNNQDYKLYSFEDWIADYVRSNLYLTTSPTYVALTNEVETAYGDVYDEDSPTNTPLPEYDDFVSGDTGGSDSLQSGADSFEQTVGQLSGMLEGDSDDEIVVIPEFTVGGIHVREYRARLSTTITPACRRIMQFIWAVALFASLFGLASSEWAFYANLGRNWTPSQFHGS